MVLVAVMVDVLSVKMKTYSAPFSARDLSPLLRRASTLVATS